MDDSLLFPLTALVAGALGSLMGICSKEYKGMAFFCLLIALYAAFTVGVKMVRLGIIPL